VEQPDQSARIPDLSLTNPEAAFTGELRKDLFGGVVVLKHSGAVYDHPLDSEPLYEPLTQARQRKSSATSLVFIPYYAWANREMSAMEVWVPLK
jgi:DUF1680 family protein